MNSPKRYALLDRDGTIIVERHYLSDPAGVELLPGAAEGMKRLRELGLGLIVVTNQSGIGRGYLDEARLAEIHGRMTALLANEGVTVDGIYHCPHTPEDQCGCRKPLPGMIDAAVKELGFDSTKAFFIGDKPCDVDAGRNVGATSILVRTGYGAKHAAENSDADYIVNDLVEAANVIGGLVSAAREN